ncbi:MAG TPA: Rieske 2Fe-2S domain-containing protein [Marmoricola sp.]
MSSRARDERPPMGVVVSFALATLAGMGFAASYVLGLGNVWYGGLLGAALMFLAIGLGLWSKLIDRASPEYVEERDVGPTPEPQFEKFMDALTAQPVPRSRVLWSMLGVAAGTVGLAALFPVRSFFPQMRNNPQRALESRVYRRGQAIVTEDGTGVKPDDLDPGGVLTVFPEGWNLKEAAGATLLIRVDPARLRLPPDRANWTVDGVVAYSKLCTHAGCPVGLYADESHQLLCPCHHSIFDVLDGAKPVEGPASHPLPMLPLGTDADGFLIARGGFDMPVGAAWWGWPDGREKP